MHSKKVANWLQILGNIGLLIGLALVVVQINQNSKLVEDQLYQSRWSDLFTYFAARMGENPAAALQKSIDAPHEMTIEEHEVMDACFNYYFYYNVRNAVLGGRGITDRDQWRLFHDKSYEFYSSANEYVFGSPYAKAWLRERMRHVSPRIAFWPAFGAHGESLPPTAARERINFLLRELDVIVAEANGTAAD